MTEGRDFWWDEEAEKVPSYCPCEPVGAEDPLFILYVSLLSNGASRYRGHSLVSYR
jgi:hypothetical protein